MRTFTSLDEVAGAVGEELGSSEWLTIEQDRVDTFADATGDHQWIHVDPDKAAEGPFGGTIAHGYLTLSLLPLLGSTVFAIDTPGAKINYGLNKVRFPNPVHVGKQVRVTVTVAGCEDISAGKQVTLKHVIEIDGEDKPACVAESIVLLLA